jgi:complex iron-sulfur molybdoenzyme family reductase subunit gamma
MKLPSWLNGRRRTVVFAVALLAVAGGLQFANVNPAVSQSVFLTAYQADSDPGLNPASDVWNSAPPVQAPLTAQAGVYAAGGGSIPTVSAKALHYKNNLYVRLEWDDSTADESTTRVQDFSDAIALEFPAQTASTVPSICMGQADGGVNIWQWRADSQKGFKDPTEVYTGALVDMYPSKEALFYTARAAGNPYANHELGPTQTLVATTFGSLSPAAVQDVKGKGVRVGTGKWAVVFSRPFDGSDGSQARFAVGAKTDMAIAVWNGSEGDRNGRKSVSQFVTLNVAGMSAPGSKGINSLVVVLAVILFVGIAGIGVGIAVYGAHEEGRP